MAGMIAKGKHRASSLGSDLETSFGGGGDSAHNPLQAARTPLLTTPQEGSDARDDTDHNQESDV